jgi:hypothetical protein
MNPVQVITKFIEEQLEAEADSGDTLHERVAMDRLPPSFKNTTTAIEVQHQSGRSATAEAPINTHQIAVKCYGGSTDDADAWAVHDRVYGVLHNQIGDTLYGGVLFCELATVSKYNDPDTGWPVVLAVYQAELK